MDGESPFVRMFTKHVGPLSLGEVAARLNDKTVRHEDRVTPGLLGKWLCGNLLPRKAHTEALSAWMGVPSKELRQAIATSGKYLSAYTQSMRPSESAAGQLLRDIRLATKLSRRPFVKLLAKHGARVAMSTLSSWELRLSFMPKPSVLAAYAAIAGTDVPGLRGKLRAALAKRESERKALRQKHAQLALRMLPEAAIEAGAPVEPAPSSAAAVVLTRATACARLAEALPPTSVPSQHLSHWGWYIARLVELLPED